MQRIKDQVDSQPQQPHAYYIRLNTPSRTTAERKLRIVVLVLLLLM